MKVYMAWKCRDDGTELCVVGAFSNIRNATDALNEFLDTGDRKIDRLVPMLDHESNTTQVAEHISEDGHHFIVGVTVYVLDAGV